MFTGIIEALGEVVKIETEGTNKTFFVASPISKDLKVDQSVSHNGVCLTIENVSDGLHRVTAIDETLSKSNFAAVEVGDRLNLERCLQLNGRVDGHIVQGHVDTIGICISTKDVDGSVEFRFRLPEEKVPYIVEKGSIAVNGISLTIYDVATNEFSVSIIPFTLSHTNIGNVKAGDRVNVEYDIIGKYILRSLQLK